jgi:RHS repeat-associated protein
LTGGLIKETDALGNFKAYAYDAAGNRSSRTDEKGNVTRYDYDNLNRLSRVTYPDGTYKTFAYDLRSNISSAMNQDIGYSFSYDLNNRLTGITDSNGRPIAYQYDALGNRSQMTTPDGRTISYARDAVNRLTGILSSPGPLNFSFSYDSAGRRTELSYPNGVTTTYSYSPSSYLTALSAQKLPQNPMNSFSYSHDGMGNRTSMTDLSGVHNYTYDSIYQLTQATHPNMPTEQFGYDFVGNRVSAEGEAVGTPVATNYTYDLENRLIKVEYPGMVAQYKHNPFGRRIEKNVNGDITRYVYDGPNIITEYDGNGNVKNGYIHNLAIDDPLAVQQDSNAYFYHKDGLGSVTSLTDSTGSVVNSYTYKSFGEIYSQTGSLQQPFTFTGRELDLESGLYYYRARYYDPKIGRFWTKDPIGLAGGDVNLYRYVGNNPIRYIDPWGLIRYNAPPPRTVPPEGATLNALQCFEQCLQNATNNPNLDLLVTGGAEQTGHSPGSRHYSGEACDVAGPRFNPINANDVSSCTAQCGFGTAQFETFPNNPNRDHWHLEMPRAPVSEQP